MIFRCVRSVVPEVSWLFSQTLLDDTPYTLEP